MPPSMQATILLRLPLHLLRTAMAMDLHRTATRRIDFFPVRTLSQATHPVHSHMESLFGEEEKDPTGQLPITPVQASVQMPLE
jgi:hypothetical protein